MMPINDDDEDSRQRRHQWVQLHIGELVDKLFDWDHDHKNTLILPPVHFRKDRSIELMVRCNYTLDSHFHPVDFHTCNILDIQDRMSYATHFLISPVTGRPNPGKS